MRYFVGIVLIFSFFPVFLYAGDATDYKLLEPLPFVSRPGEMGTSNPQSYITGIVQLVIAVASALAVIKIIYGGFQYMSTDAFTGKNDAKQSRKLDLSGA